jgi:hypothetical protein
MRRAGGEPRGEELFVLPQRDSALCCSEKKDSVAKAIAIWSRCGIIQNTDQLKDKIRIATDRLKK